MTELTLERGVPVLATPSLNTTSIQNSMQTHDDLLYASTSGITTEKWTYVVPGDSIKFETPMYLMQDSWDVHVFPVIET